ncbi:MAG: DUF998 domain-containing protein [Euryarchaeota archaeon]|nr:DUF998 domain-containing protein [Euryarchaeota archaeon]
MKIPSRLAGACGILAPVLGWLFILASIAANPWFSWTGHALSHLGSPASTNPALFNTGLILTGGLGLLMTLGFAASSQPQAERDLRGRMGLLLLAVSLFALAGVGVFPWPHPPGLPASGIPEFTPTAVAHTATAATFFLLTPVSLLLIGRSAQYRGQPLGRLSILLGLGSLGTVLAFPAFVFGAANPEGVAIPEAIAALFTTAASIRFGVHLLRGPELTSTAPGHIPESAGR